MDTIRIDKWLWAVRLYKTRSLATEACRTGKIVCEGQEVKASRIPKPGDIYEIQQGTLNKRVQVKALLKNRVSAKLVVDYAIDLTPAEEYERIQLMRELNYERRPRGTGRPTKRERRDIDRLKDDD
ncbi:MAG: S4 domain-containing protein [Bacteroidales bacterium]|jgi:ribosome-associated heat shock protein Hsp15|nr:S4 domain-containing protein [Bacteroidales bacterium]